MADKFHVVAHPGTEINIGDTLTIAFDSPKEADPVTVTLNEVDAWVSGGSKITEGGGTPVLVAEFEGKIVAGKFTGKLTKQGKSTATNPPALRVLFDGQAAATATQSIPIPDATLANEDGIFEIEIAVKGTINKRNASFTTPSPVFVRNFKSGKPVVSFITGSGTGYFIAADAFMKTYADGTFSLGTVLEIREFLRTQAKARGFGPWGEANIVSHGNAVEWVLLAAPGATNSKGAPLVHLRWWDIKDLQGKPAFATSISTELASDSRLVIRGCAIGNDQRLLDEIKKLFGGKTTVFAPKFLQFYEVKGGVSRESFFEFFFFFAKAQAAPSDAVCVAELKKKFPSSGISDADWLSMLQNPNEDPNGFRASHGGALDRHETIPWTPSVTVNHPEEPRKNGALGPRVTAAIAGIDWLGNTKSQFNSALPQENLETTFDDWFWVQDPVVETPKGTTKTLVSRIHTGHRVRVEVRRELRDASGTPVKPSLTNTAHYGRST